MEGQLIIQTRPDSPIRIITTSSYNPSQQIPQHSVIVTSSNSVQRCTNESSKNRICRDFVRGTCRRLYCKYPHVQSHDLVVFCHDFQNNKCPRINCKFLHYSIEDEEHYRKYGEFPIGQDDFNNINQNSQANHQQQAEYQSELNSFFNGSSANRSLPSLLDESILFQPCQRHECCHNDRNTVFRNGLKRMNSQDRDCMQTFKRSREDEIMTVLRRFDEEHQMLKRRVEANELKIAELRASNEYLLTQNAQLRMATVQVSRVVNPVTVTQTQSQQSQGPQVISAQCHSQLVSTPIVSMSTPQTQIIATPQNMSGGPTLALTNTSQPTQQILGTTQQITLAPHAALAPSISTPINTISINTSQAALQAAISNATQPIISYPIMTHSILPH